MMMVKISDAAVGIAPTPAPLASCPKKIMHDTMDQTSQVYGCGCTRFLTMSIRYGTLPMTARTDAMIAIISFMTHSVSLLVFVLPRLLRLFSKSVYCRHE